MRRSNSGRGCAAGFQPSSPVGLGDLESAWEIGVHFHDQDFSLVDRTSFAVMWRLGLERAASLDDRFALYRYGPDRRKAFTVMR